MYAFISNEYRTIVNTQSKLELLCGIYSYPKFVKVNNEHEARKFFAEQDRKFFTSGINMYGAHHREGYVTIEYFIDKNTIYYNVYTDKLGTIRLSELPKGVKMTTGQDYFKVVINNIVLDNVSIAHHCLTINRILRLLPLTLNVHLRLPDISVFLALVKYTGKNYIIKQTQSCIRGRLGETFYSFE